MKKLILLAITLFSIGCSEYEVVDTKVVKGVVSATEEGHAGRVATPPSIYIQDSKQTMHISIPFANEKDFKVGDTALLVIQQVVKK